MFKFLTNAMLLLFSVIALAGCGNSNDPDNPDTPQPSTSQNTVFVFMPYTANDNGRNSLYSNLIGNINDMEKSISENNGLPNGTNLVVFISKDENTSNMISIKYSKNKCVRDTIKTYIGYTYNTEDGMIALLGDVKQLAPANTYSMIVGCHGEGWLPKKTTRWFGGQKYQIDVSDLAKAIESSGMHMNYILFDDCYMSSIEVAYTLRNSANYLIASTSEMMDYGMPYHRIMKYLLNTKVDFQAVCNEFIDFYKHYSMPYGTIAVTNLSKMDDIRHFMSWLNEQYTFDKNKIEDIQDLDADHFEPTVYFDLRSYIHILTGNEATTEFDEGIEKELVPYKAATDYIYSYSGHARREVKEFSGLTISDPSENTIAIDTKKQTEWWKATHSTTAESTR